MTIYGFKDFNNYYNRRVKGQNLSTITEFINTFGEFYYMQSDTYGNFSERDGVVTSHVLGTQGNPYFGECDYLLVCDDNHNITSRWFIIDQDMKMYGQFTVNLYRDVVADNWNNIIKAPMFIEKATLQDDDPLIYNQENVSLNQIKKGEYLIKDESNCAWLVAYLEKGYSKEDLITITMNTMPDYTISSINGIATQIGYPSNTPYRTLLNSIADFNIYKMNWVSNAYVACKYNVRINNNQLYVNNMGVDLSFNRNTDWCLSESLGEVSDSEFVSLIQAKIPSDASSVIKTNTLTDLSSRNYNIPAYNTIFSYNNVIFLVDDEVNDQKYYQINSNLTNSNGYALTLPVNSTIASYIETFLSTIPHTGSKIKNPTVDTNENVVNYDYTEITADIATFRLGHDYDRIQCRDVFDLMCIPYADHVKITNTAMTWTDFTYTKEEALAYMQAIAEQLGQHIYDVQLVPYSPFTGFLYTTETIGGQLYSVINLHTSVPSRYRLIKDSNEVSPKCICLFAANNKGTKDIAVNYLPVTNKKLQNQTEIVRLSSPNYAAQFDFNVARNNGVNYFNVDYNYLPYRPYIHVAPIWNADGLYGSDYNDAKGLICGGDFSVSYLSDAWVNYQVQNKNYEEIFNRGTQNLDTVYKYQKTQSIVSGAVGGLSGALTGGATGMMLGGPVGAAIGAGVGLAASAAGAVADIAIQENLHNEAMDYRKDLFDMQLDNIQALPDTIKKVTAINENNKIWPFVEIYQCTDREKNALAEKIAWNGMTVGVIGKIEDYLGNSWNYNTIYDKGYIKGQLIRTEGICDDTHMINAIADELNKGVYTK